MDMFGAALEGLKGVFAPQAFWLMMFGVVLGNIVGFVPGLGGNFLLAVLIPFVFGMNPVAAFALLLGAHAVTATGGSISAILFNTPGTGPNAPTCFDGFEMTKKGQAGRAPGAAPRGPAGVRTRRWVARTVAVGVPPRPRRLPCQRILFPNESTTDH